jgi:catechol 2,3-dioxygenase-like lactoylglutathione lyase family enzyme
MAVLQLDHVASPSFDPAATHRFYTELVGARLALAVDGVTSTGRHYLVVEYALANTRLAFLTYAGMRRIADDGLPEDIRHVAFNVSDASELRDWHDRFAAAGVRTWTETHGHDDLHVYALDPNGMALEFALPWVSDEAVTSVAQRAAETTVATWVAAHAAR